MGNSNRSKHLIEEDYTRLQTGKFLSYPDMTLSIAILRLQGCCGGTMIIFLDPNPSRYRRPLNSVKSTA